MITRRWQFGGLVAAFPVLWAAVQLYGWSQARLEAWVDRRVAAAFVELEREVNALRSEVAMELCAQRGGRWWRGDCERP